MLISISLVAASETTIGIDDYSVEPNDTITATIRINNPPGTMTGDVVGEAGNPVGDGVVDMMDAPYIARYESGRVEEV